VTFRMDIAPGLKVRPVLKAISERRRALHKRPLSVISRFRPLRRARGVILEMEGSSSIMLALWALPLSQQNLGLEFAGVVL